MSADVRTCGRAAPGGHPRTRSRTAFTLVELLVVVAVIAVLASLLLVAVRALGIGSKRARTESVLAAVRDALDLTLANRAVLPSPAEHPLAGSRAGRAPAVGLRGRVLDAAGVPTGGVRTVLVGDGEALKGAFEWHLASDRERALMDDDRLADPGLPLLYGARRALVGVPGAAMEAATRYRRIPYPRAPLRTAAAPYTAARYDDELHLIAPTGRAADSRKSLAFLFGQSNTESELAGLGALFEPPDDDPAHRLRPPQPIAGSNRDGNAIDNAGRVWSADGPGRDAPRATWEPGRVQDGALPDGADAGKPAWHRYRLRGLGIYDAWGVEILYSVDAKGAARLLSAGADGVLRWHPGEDGAYATEPDADAPAGDDRDGARDNLRAGAAD